MLGLVQSDGKLDWCRLCCCCCGRRRLSLALYLSLFSVRASAFSGSLSDRSRESSSCERRRREWEWMWMREWEWESPAINWPLCVGCLVWSLTLVSPSLAHTRPSDTAAHSAGAAVAGTTAGFFLIAVWTVFVAFYLFSLTYPGFCSTQLVNIEVTGKVHKRKVISKILWRNSFLLSSLLCNLRMVVGRFRCSEASLLQIVVIN